MARLSGWVGLRLGLSHEMLRPAPAYSINPFYWLGALAVVAFVIQGVTGILMMIYYVPSPSQAYASTQYIFQNVSYGRFLETVHLYTTYAMIMLVFMHLMRGYFVSVHKKPREVMWFVGMVMGFVTLGFGFTGYLLPWTVVSKSATDVGLGMINALPKQVSSFLSFIVVGTGGDASVLLRFFELHVVVLPAALLVLLVVKMYMLEAHGVSAPVIGEDPVPARKRKSIPILPDVSLYLLELAALFGAAVLLISVIFPLNLPPEYTPTLASQYVPQPDWYFLWIYQILKLSLFEELVVNGVPVGVPVALSIVSLVFVVLFVLPLIDRGTGRRIAGRSRYVTLGLVFVAEILVLTFWGLLTPGSTIPDEQAALVLGGTALAVALISLVSYRLLFSWRRTGAIIPKKGVDSESLRSSALRTSAAFVVLLVLGALAVGAAINAAAGAIVSGGSLASVGALGLSLMAVGAVVVATAALLYRLDFGVGTIKRRVRWLEWGRNE